MADSSAVLDTEVQNAQFNPSILKSNHDLNEKQAAEFVPVWSSTKKSGPVAAIKSKLMSSQAVGLISLIGVISLWLGSSMLTQDILKNYNKPMLMTFLSVISMQSYFVFLKLKDPLVTYLESKSYNSLAPKATEPIGLKQTAKIAFSLFFIYSVGLYFVNACLKYTTLASASILGATCSFFTLFLGSLLNVERFSLWKGAAVVVTFTGVVVNSLPSILKSKGISSMGTQSWGNFLSLLSAACYATFLVFLQKQTVGKTGLNRPLLFAFIGLFTMIFCWPIFIYLHKTGQERLELPPNGMVWLFLGLKVVLGSVVPTYLWNVTFALTSPLYIAVGTSLSIPLNLAADYLMGNAVNWAGMVGAAFVTAGCFIMNMAEI